MIIGSASWSCSFGSGTAQNTESKQKNRNLTNKQKMYHSTKHEAISKIYILSNMLRNKY